MQIAPSLRRTAAAALTTPLLLTGCGAGSGGGSPSGETPRVVASFYALEYVAQRVAGEHAQVEGLAASGADPHDMELNVSQTATIADADLVVYEKGFQPAVDSAVEQSGPDRVVEATEVVELRSIGEEHEEGEHAEEPHGDEHADEHAEEPHADEHGHAEESPADEHRDEHAEEPHADEHADAHEHGHAEGDLDLHFWLDPERLGELAAEVQHELAELDPENAAAYEANLEALQSDLAALDDEYTEGLADCQRDTVVVSHDAFGYLGKYGLHFEPIAGLSPDAEPSAAHLAELGEVIRREGVTTVFSERLASPAMAQTLARDLDVETAVLDPIEGLSDETADEDYVSLMRANLEALRSANGCR